MSDEIFTVLVNGQRYTAFESVEVQASVNEAARSFSLQVAAEVGGPAIGAMFAAGTPVQIFANDDQLFDGYIDRRRPRLTATSADVTISGRAKGQDAVDCSVIHPTGNFQNLKPHEVLRQLDQFGIGFSAAVSLDAVPRIQVTQGETLHQLGARLARQQNVNLVGQADGSIKLWNASVAKRLATPLIEGQNIKMIEADHNWSGRHSHHHVRGQRAHGVATGDLQVEATATDESVTRYRPHVIVQSEDTDKARAIGRATTKRDRTIGRSLSATTEIQGVRGDDGVLFNAGFIVYVESPFAEITQDMLIEHIAWRQSSAGTLTRLGLVDPAAHGGKSPKFSKSGPGWKASHTKAS